LDVHLTEKLAEMVLSEQDRAHRQQRKDEEGKGRKAGEEDLKVSNGAVSASGRRPPGETSTINHTMWDRLPGDVLAVTTVALQHALNI
jgi:hypothetical protein